MKTMSVMRCGVVAVAFLVAMGVSAERAAAIPILQIYMEGATYDETTESWTLSPADSSSGAPFKVWTIGNISAQGGKGTISHVKLAVSYSSEFGELDIQLTPSTVSPEFQDAFDDAGAPGAPTRSQYVSDVATGGVPKLTGGKDLPSHGEYQAGVAWQEFLLGDFDDPTDAKITDFNENFTDSTVPEPGGQINVYDVQVFAAGGGSAHGVRLHFDLYDSVQSQNKGVFAPFSHDADGTANIVPSPAAPLVGGICFALLGMMRPTRRRQD